MKGEEDVFQVIVKCMENGNREDLRVPFDQNFRKFRFNIEWNRNSFRTETHFENFGNLWKLSFFPEMWKFRKFSVPFDISSRHDSCLVPVAVSVASAKGKGVGVDISNYKV